jgi:hypothetical protein
MKRTWKDRLLDWLITYVICFFAILAAEWVWSKIR